jgi:hypothetical protein
MDDFAHLRHVHRNGDLEFDFFYRVAPHDAVAHEALTVNVSVFARTIKHRPVLENTHTGFVDTRKLIGNILTHMPQAKSVIKQRQEFNVAFRSSDVSARVNNEIVGQLRAKVPARGIQQMIKPVMKLMLASDVKEAAEVKPVLQQIAHEAVADISTVHSASIDENPTRLMHDMIVRQGVDPSHVLHLTHRSVPSVDAVGGILRPTRAHEVKHSPLSRLLNFHIFPPAVHFRPLLTNQVQDTTFVHVLSYEPETHVEVPVTVIVPRHALRLDGRDHSHFFAKFELINGRTGVAVDTVIKPLDTARHVQLFYTPRRPPIVKVTRSEVSTRANLEIKQIDPGATAVQVYKKNLYRAITDIEDYTLIGTYNVRRNEQSLLVQVDLPRNSTAIYRVVPVGNQGTQGFDYTNVVVRPARYRPIKSLALTAQATDIGVRLEARQIPQHVVAIEFKARNKTIFEPEFHNVGGDVTLIDEAVRTSDYLTVVDRDVSSNNIYEYVARLIYESGTDELAGNATIEFVQPVPGKIDTRIDNVTVDQANEPNVTFNITTTIIDNNLDVVKALLQRQDIYDLFKDDVMREREFLKNLIAHNVQRVDLTTGVREDFGVVTTPSFSDRDLRKNQAIRPLQLGHRYRYEVTALLRAPETMFETLAKEKVDVVTKKTYAFNPAKFMHPLTLSRGIIVTTAGLRTRYSKEVMSHGAIGAVESVEVSFDDEPARIIDPSASRFDKFLNIITWKLEGDIDQIDHFLIMKDVHGVRTMIGKAHSEFQYGNCQYLHPVSRRDEGSLSYVIVPIFNNYKTGTQVETNAVVVEPFPTFARFAPR